MDSTVAYHGRPTGYSYERVYSLDYSVGQLKKFLLRRDNHWKIRINHVLETLCLLDLAGNTVLDLGTSIGTFAFELAQRGYQVTGIDVDEKAIDIARRVAEHYGLSVNYVTADASIPDTFAEDSFDVIVAEDIFEHLHDDVLERVLSNCYRWLKPGGYLVFHTFPTRFDYIFRSSKWWIPLAPLAWLSDERFCRLVEIYHRHFLNPWRKLRTGKTFEESIQYSTHCNLLTATHLRALLEKAGFWVLKLETQNLYPWSAKGVRGLLFRNKQYFHRNITGICWKPLW
jgi:SAM-dependent methyltransferase